MVKPWQQYCRGRNGYRDRTYLIYAPAAVLRLRRERLEHVRVHARLHVAAVVRGAPRREEPRARDGARVLGQVGRAPVPCARIAQEHCPRRRRAARRELHPRWLLPNLRAKPISIRSPQLDAPNANEFARRKDWEAQYNLERVLPLELVRGSGGSRGSGGWGRSRERRRRASRARAPSGSSPRRTCAPFNRRAQQHIRSDQVRE
eukprot:COSAG05_NODE_952_length_6466_cov_3.122350_8_plen_204_part_00